MDKRWINLKSYKNAFFTVEKKPNINGYFLAFWHTGQVDQRVATVVKDQRPQTVHRVLFWPFGHDPLVFSRETLMWEINLH